MWRGVVHGQMDPERKNLSCSVCQGRGGAAVQCASQGCFKAVHPFCAQGTRKWFLGDFVNSSGGLEFNLYCPTHYHEGPSALTSRTALAAGKSANTALLATPSRSAGKENQGPRPSADGLTDTPTSELGRSLSVDSTELQRTSSLRRSWSGSQAAGQSAQRKKRKRKRLVKQSAVSANSSKKAARSSAEEAEVEKARRLAKKQRRQQQRKMIGHLMDEEAELVRVPPASLLCCLSASRSFPLHLFRNILDLLSFDLSLRHEFVSL